MNKRFKVALMTLSLSLFMATALFSQDAQYFLHTVTKGQGLYSISRMYGVSEESIIKINPGSERSIRVGQSLKIPQNKKSNSDYRFHTVKQGETLYRLSVENRVSIKDICDANPGLSSTNFRIGQVIMIPAPNDKDPLESAMNAENNLPPSVMEHVEVLSQDISEFRTTHVVAKRETVYKICKSYGITQDEFFQANPESKYKKLKVGTTINIPYSESEKREQEVKRDKAEKAIQSVDDATLFNLNRGDIKHYDNIKAALILPFELEDSATQDQKKMVEFYQGVLLALDKLKAEGVSVDLKVIDSKGEGTSIAPILNSRDMLDIDIIFGPKYDNQISEASEFSKKQNIPLILPINSNSQDVFSNPNIFQLNTPQSYFQQEILENFRKQFKKPNVIILNSELHNNSSFIKGLIQMMKTENISNITLPVDTAATPLLSALKPGFQNIFILNTSVSGPLTDMIPVLQLINRTKDPEIETALFGYPEYQIYAADHLDEFFEINTYFYSWFYTNNTLQESVDFHTKFRRAFSRQMMISYPSFASYGYDMAYYFLKGLSQYGSDFERHLNDIDSNPVQMGFKFERVNNWGGFINKKVYFVHLANDFSVQKIDFDK